MTVSGSMSLRQVRSILRSWTNDAPPPVRTQILVLRSLEKLKVKAQERASQAGRDRLTKALARAARALRPPKRARPSVNVAASGLLTGSMLAKELGLSQDQVSRLKVRGVLQGRVIGRRMLFSLDESRTAIATHTAAVEEAKAGTRRRAAELTCSNCKRLLPRASFIERTERQRRGNKTYEYKTASSECRDCLKEQKREWRRRKAEACGKEFMPRGDRAKYEARIHARREERKRQRRIAWALCCAFRALVALSPEERRKRAVDRQRVRYNTDPVYQAKRKALKIRRKRAQKGTQVVPVNREVVARRDGWCCGICGGKVTRATWSLDHVIPLSRGGTHTYGNVVLAHRSCNSRRGAGRLPVQAPLFATL